MPEKIGGKFITPTQDGQIEWKTEDWGAIVTEKTFHPSLSFGSKSSWTEKKLRVPWSVLDAVRETGPKEPEPVKSAKFQFRGMDAEVVVELKAKHGTIRVPISDFSTFESKPMAGFGEFRIMVGSPLLERLYGASNEYKKNVGP